MISSPSRFWRFTIGYLNETMIQIVDYHIVGSEKWNSYVLHHENGTIFQTTFYLDCHSSVFNSEFFGFAAVIRGDIVGVVAGIILYNYIYPLSNLTRRAIIEGGPIANDKCIEEQLIEAVTEYTKRRSIYTQYRNLWDTSPVRPAFERLGYQYEPHLDILHDLTLETECIIKSISKNKRGNVHKSINKGTAFREAEESEWGACIDLILGTYKRVGLPCQSRSYFFNAFKSLSGSVKVFVADLKGIIIGTRVELCFKDLVYDWYAGADDKYKSFYPNDVLPYYILLWGKENGYKTFDFGGAGRPDVPYGVRDHKMKFGGQLVEYGRFERVNHKLIYGIASKAIAWKKKVREKTDD